MLHQTSPNIPMVGFSEEIVRNLTALPRFSFHYFKNGHSIALIDSLASIKCKVQYERRLSESVTRQLFDFDEGYSEYFRNVRM